MLLVDAFLEETAKRSPESLALVSGQRRLSYRQLNDSAQALSAALLSIGVSAGDRVVIHLENGVEAVVSIFGALKADCVFVPVNPTVKPEKLAYVLNDCSASVLISDQREAISSGVLAGVPSVRVVLIVGDTQDKADALPDGLQTFSFDALLEAHRGAPPKSHRCIDLDLAALIYTSGSTGGPKGVMLSHANVVTAATSIAAYLEMASDDVVLNILPLSFDYGLYQLFLTCKTGGCLVLDRAFVYPSRVLDLIVRERVTGLPIVPMIAALLLRQDLAAYDLSSLRYISNTGAVLQPTAVKALRERLPHVRIFKMYGLTECKRVSFLAPEEIDRRPTSVGKPMDNVEVYLIDKEGHRLDNGVGELVVRGSNVMQGYWGAPDDTARVLKPGPYPGEMVLHTGDIFRMDEEGYLYFLSRSDDIIKSRGQKVSPREVEAVLYMVPDVQEACVLGVPDDVAGAAIKAYVTLVRSHAVTEQELLLHCSRHLEDFMVPRSIEIVATMPHTASGKVAGRSLQGGPASA